MKNLKKVFRSSLSFLTLFAVSFNCVAEELSDRELRRLAQEGNVSASYNLGVRLLKKDDRVRAFEYFVQSAEGGLPIGQYQAAQMYRKGDGTEQDHTMALELYREAYEGGIEKASFYLLLVQSDPSSQEYNPIAASILLETVNPSLTEGRKKQIFEIAQQLEAANKDLADGILTRLDDVGYEPAVLALTAQADEVRDSERPIPSIASEFTEPTNNLEPSIGDVAQKIVSVTAKSETPSIKSTEISAGRSSEIRNLSSKTASQIQQGLKDLAYYEGNIDGQWGPNSERSLREFGRDINQEIALELEGAEVLKILSDSVLLPTSKCKFKVDAIQSNTAFSCFQVTI